MARRLGMFDVEERLAGLSNEGDDLERLAAVVDFELFRPELERAVPRADRAKATTSGENPRAGRCRCAARANANKSAIWVHIEHIFAEQKPRMGLFVRTIGLTRATTKIGLANLQQASPALAGTAAEVRLTSRPHPLTRHRGRHGTPHQHDLAIAWLIASHARRTLVFGGLHIADPAVAALRARERSAGWSLPPSRLTRLHEHHALDRRRRRPL